MQETILPREADTSIDTIETSLQNISQNIAVFVFGLLPLFFIPVAFDIVSGTAGSNIQAAR